MGSNFPSQAPYPEDVTRRIAGTLLFRLRGCVCVQGRDSAVKVFELVGLRSNKAPDASPRGEPTLSPPAVVNNNDHSLSVQSLGRMRNVVINNQALTVEKILSDATFICGLRDAEFCDSVSAGMQAYLNKDFAEGWEILKVAHASNPSDADCAKFMEECHALMLNPPDSSWSGVYKATSK